VIRAEKKFRAMGTDIFLLVLIDSTEDHKKTENLLELIEQKYKEWEKIFSRFDPESELSKTNKNLGKQFEASVDFIEVARRCLSHYKETEGLFDPRIIENLESSGYNQDFKKNDFKPSDDIPREISGNLAEDLIIEKISVTFRRKMDFSGIVKGWATDKVMRLVAENNLKNFLIDSGGDIYVAGSNEQGKKWKITIEGIEEQKLQLEVSGRGIATSGITRRKWQNDKGKFHHLVNPKNPDEYSFKINSVTVVASSTESADVWAKFLFLSGLEEGLKLARDKNMAAIFLDRRGNARYSDAMKKYLILTNDINDRKRK
jgi:thiamine biosynthesis lipoprotein